MGFVAAFEPVVRAAWATGLLCFAVSAALVVQVLRMRRRLERLQEGTRGRKPADGEQVQVKPKRRADNVVYGNRFQLLSAGRDRTFGTDDDLAWPEN